MNKIQYETPEIIVIDFELEGPVSITDSGASGVGLFDQIWSDN